MSVTFFAGPADLAVLAESLFLIPGLTVYEAYSQAGAKPLSFTTAPPLQAALAGARHGHFRLWWAETMRRPAIRRISLRAGGHRYTVEGCGLFALLPGALSETVLTPTALTWFSEAGARAKCGVTPGPAAVNWPEHRRVGNRLTSLVRRTLAVASTPGRPVLPEALALHAAGRALKDDPSTPWSYAVGAT